MKPLEKDNADWTGKEKFQILRAKGQWQKSSSIDSKSELQKEQRG